MKNNLIKQYGFSIYYHSNLQKQLLYILILRSEIAFQSYTLHPNEQLELLSYDRLLFHHAHDIYKRIQSYYYNLSHTYPSSHWWWHLENFSC
ncbi:hypothetical protein [Bacillus sp. S14(2024)]|uniref:hypothetical protein n=1 Tax=Bacillus sp. S14(2024) TaxID=3162884 RepID=UPI003D25B96D